jgi:hypothetical protein
MGHFREGYLMDAQIILRIMKRIFITIFSDNISRSASEELCESKIFNLRIVRFSHLKGIVHPWPRSGMEKKQERISFVMPQSEISCPSAQFCSMCASYKDIKRMTKLPGLHKEAI